MSKPIAQLSDFRSLLLLWLKKRKKLDFCIYSITVMIFFLRLYPKPIGSHVGASLGTDYYLLLVLIRLTKHSHCMTTDRTQCTQCCGFKVIWVQIFWLVYAQTFCNSSEFFYSRSMREGKRFDSFVFCVSHLKRNV